MKRSWVNCLVGILASLLIPVVGADAAERLQVQAVRIVEQDAATRVGLRLSRSADFRMFTLTGPDRVVLDISAAALGRTALPLPDATGSVREVRAAHRDGNLRIVFDLTAPMRPSSSLVNEGTAALLTIDLQPVAMAAVAAPAPAPAATPEPKPAAAPEPGPAAVPAAPAVTAKPARPVRDIVVVVDAGHGGHDPGALGSRGLREKDVTLAISRRLVDLINSTPNMRGVLTRSDDRFLDLRARMERARSVSADLFISIHADAAMNRSARGSTVYVLSEKAASDEASRRLAARENAALIGGVELGNKDPVLASVLMDLSQNASISSSISVGDAILGEMASLGRLHRDKVQHAPFMVLKSPDVPSILIETAYISNPEDERNLGSAQHQDKLARAVLGGIRRYFDSNPARGVMTADAGPPEAPRSDIRHVIRRGDTLSGIADRYNISMQRIRAVNGLRSDTVRLGQTLRIPAEST
ncbi:MAG: N-acetylmuramoyl-L-alanine amidase [Gammaproteobacteria bacterium]|nr:N-acetylmuramoyl-L-alanine amidase [Gammaproteobacteria bacterium]